MHIDHHRDAEPGHIHAGAIQEQNRKDAACTCSAEGGDVLHGVQLGLRERQVSRQLVAPVLQQRQRGGRRVPVLLRQLLLQIPSQYWGQVLKALHCRTSLQGYSSEQALARASCWQPLANASPQLSHVCDDRHEHQDQQCASCSKMLIAMISSSKVVTKLVSGSGKTLALEIASVPLEVSESYGRAKALLIEAAGNVVLQVAQHLPVHCLDLGAPLAAAAQCPLLQGA